MDLLANNRDCGYGLDNGILQMNSSGGFQADNITVEDGGSDGVMSRRRRNPAVKKNRRLLSKIKKSKCTAAADFVLPPLPANIVNQGRMAFLFFKKLQNSDVNNFSNIGRTILPKKASEAHLPVLLDNESIMLHMNDMDGVHEWLFKFRYWSNNRSRMYVLEGTGKFNKKHGLQKGDYMLLYQDLVNQNYVVRAVRANEVEKCARKQVRALRGNKADKELADDDADDFTSQNWNAAVGLESFEAYNLPNSFAKMDDNISYLSEFVSSWDELMTNYWPATQLTTSFDNLSSEDLSQV